ncbi:hypothetical protein [Halorubrum halophilum]|nr:hypothetical protein [Halorubrum halophilum]
MSASVDRLDPPWAVRPIVRRYHRVERTVSWVLALSVVAVALIAIRSLPFYVGVIAALGVLALVRVPLVRRRGDARLETDADPDTVRAEFGSKRPPVLIFQWGLVETDDVTVDDEAVEYDISYLFGLRSVTMRVEPTDRLPDESGSDRSSAVDELELVVTVDGNRWAAYTVRIREREERTVVDVAWTTDHRVDVRQLVQGLVARRYYPEALAALGYETVMRDVSWSL